MKVDADTCICGLRDTKITRQRDKKKEEGSEEREDGWVTKHIG